MKIYLLIIVSILLLSSKTHSKSIQQEKPPLLSQPNRQDSKMINFNSAAYNIKNQHEKSQEETVDQQTQLIDKNEHEGNPTQQQHKEEKQQQGQKNTHAHIPGVGLSIVFIFGSLLYGSLLKIFSRLTSIPYNPLMLISGILLGLNYAGLGILGQSIELISKANPSGILAIFLPILIFQSAFKAQWHVFKKLASQSLIIGILSSVCSAALIALFLKVVIDPSHQYYGWSEAFLMGSILSCSDILSFVNKLKRGGTPQKLTSLLEGQSLFSYCTCVLIVEITHLYQQQKQFSGFFEYFKLFVYEIGGGILVGVIVGAILVYCIKRMIYDGILVAALMVIFTYTIYLGTEFSSLTISGITTLAVFGLYMNALGKTWLFGETQEIVSSFWSYLVFVAQTSIFMIAGVMVGSSMLHFQSDKFNISNELYITVYIYLFVVFARFASIGIFYKYLKKLGQGLSWRQIFALTFTGLKGGIGIALAMQTYRSKDFEDIISYLILMHVTSNSLITLFIHGTTASLLVNALGISSQKKVQYKFFKEYLYSFKASVQQRMLYLKQQTGTNTMIQWDEVESQIGLPTYVKMAQQTDNKIQNGSFDDESKFQKSLMFKLQNALKEYTPQGGSLCDDHLTDKNALFDLQVEFRKRFLKDLIAKYWQFHDNNQTTPAALMILIQSANYDLDREAEQIESWNWIKNEISFNMRIFSELMKVTVINELAKSSLFQYVSFCYDVVSSYIKANQEVRQELSIFYQKCQHHNEDEERHILANILRESQENQKQAEFFLINYLEPSFPQIQKEVKTRKVSFFILHSFKDIIDKNNQNGQLQPNQYDMLNHIIDSKALELNLASPKWQETNLFQILSEQKQKNAFAELPPNVLELLSNELGQKFTFDANQRIIDNSEIAKYMFFVKKGGCIVEFTNQSIVYKEPMLAGNTFGFQSLVTNIYHSKATANTMAEIIQVKKSLILKIFDTFPKVEESFWKRNVFQCYKMFVRKDDISYQISHVQKQQVQEMLQGLKIKRVEPTTIEELETDMIFIRGNIQVMQADDMPSSGQKLSKDHDSSCITSQAAFPFYFASRLKQIAIKVKEPSIFLVGQVDYEIFDRVSKRLSRNNSWKAQKKKSLG